MAGVLAVAVACAEWAGPDPVVTPRLRTLSIDDLASTLRHGGIVYVNARPADTIFRLQSGQRVPVDMNVSSGDRVSVGLYRLLCPPRDRGGHYSCFEFTVFMDEGVHVTSVADEVAAMGGRFQLVAGSGRFATVTLFDPDDLVRRARSARSWPGVAFTELTGFFCAPDAPGCISLSDLRVPVPVDTGAAVPGDGILQVRSGDTVFARYQQPDGGVLEAWRTVP